MLKYLYSFYVPFGQYIYHIGTKYYKLIVGITIWTNYTPFVVDLLLFCYERDFTLSLTKVKLISLKLLILLHVLDT